MGRTIVNTGISSDRVEHLQERWQADVLDHRPDVLHRHSRAGEGGRRAEAHRRRRADLDLKRPIVRRLAQRYGAAFVPLQDAMDEAVKERGPGVVAADGVHPSAFGSALIARLWLTAYDSLEEVA